VLPPASARLRAPAPATASRGSTGGGRLKAPPVLVELTRGDRVESRHRGSIAVGSVSGHLVASTGDPDAFIYLRSSAKPFQLAPFVASGRFDAYDFPSPVEALAIMAASHAGEDRHARTVQALLRAGGLTREVLACGTHPPYDRETAQRLVRDAEPPSTLRHNCSGKHAGMALHAKAAGWPVETYWQPDHPIQRAALETVSSLTDVPEHEIAQGTDGCGVVTFGLPLRGLALAYARLADPSEIPDEALRHAFVRIRDAMMAHPELVAGERGMFDTALMRAATGRLVSKGGAEGVQAVGVLPPDPRALPDAGEESVGLALKIEDGDGARRARAVASLSALAQLGVLGSGLLADRLGEFSSPPVLDPRGNRSGSVTAAFRLS
jgi:L-asparaginase II